MKEAWGMAREEAEHERGGTAAPRRGVERRRHGALWKTRRRMERRHGAAGEDRDRRETGRERGRIKMRMKRHRGK